MWHPLKKTQIGSLRIALCLRKTGSGKSLCRFYRATPPANTPKEVLFLDRENVIEYVTANDWSVSRLGLDRVYELLERMGNPQNKMRYVHIAGTNGKSSVSCMTASVLSAAGYKTGLYTSPYVNCFNERMQVDGVQITDEELVAVTQKVRRFADAMEDHPTEFELVTVIAFEWFAQKGCDFVSLEVGLGGRLDATNAIETPALAIITTIDLDHTDVLGDTLEKIACEKAGIIKPGGDVLLYPQQPQVEALIRETCQRVGARLTQVDLAPAVSQKSDFTGQLFTYGRYKNMKTPFLGPYQIYNAATVITGMELLRDKGYAITDENIRQGLGAARWPARFELMQTLPPFIVDGGHNPQCICMLKEALEHYFPGQKIIFIAGVMADKDYKTMFAMIAPLAKKVYCVEPNNPRALPAKDLAAFFKAQGVADVVECPKAQAAVKMALAEAGKDDVICAFGSFYMAGDIRACFDKE